MQELVIKKIEDLKKLEGWTISAVEMQAGNNPILTLTLKHHVASCPVKLHVIGDVNFGRSGNIMIVNPALTFKTENVEG